MSDYPTRQSLWSAAERERRNLSCPACKGTYSRKVDRIWHNQHPDDCRRQIQELSERVRAKRHAPREAS